MSRYRRREFLKFGAALPLALQSLELRGATEPVAKAPPRRIIFVCNSLGFYEPNFFSSRRGDIDTSPYLKGLEVREKMTVFQNCLLYTSPSPRDGLLSRMPSSA